jgi:hypothetical protein
MVLVLCIHMGISILSIVSLVSRILPQLHTLRSSCLWGFSFLHCGLFLKVGSADVFKFHVQCRDCCAEYCMSAMELEVEVVFAFYIVILSILIRFFIFLSLVFLRRNFFYYILFYDVFFLKTILFRFIHSDLFPFRPLLVPCNKRMLFSSVFLVSQSSLGTIYRK